MSLVDSLSDPELIERLRGDLTLLPQDPDVQMKLARKLTFCILSSKDIEESDSYIKIALALSPEPVGLVIRNIMNLDGLMDESGLRFVMESAYSREIFDRIEEAMSGILANGHLTEEQAHNQAAMYEEAVSNFETMDPGMLARMLFVSDTKVEIKQEHIEHIFLHASHKDRTKVLIEGLETHFNLVKNVSPEARSKAIDALRDKSRRPIDRLQIEYRLTQADDPLTLWEAGEIGRMGEEGKSILLCEVLTDDSADGPMSELGIKQILSVASLEQFPVEKATERIWTNTDGRTWEILAKKMVKEGRKDLLEQSFKISEEASPWGRVKTLVWASVVYELSGAMKEESKEVTKELLGLLNELPPRESGAEMNTAICDLKDSGNYRASRIFETFLKYKKGLKNRAPRDWADIASALAEKDPLFFRAGLRSKVAFPLLVNDSQKTGEMLLSGRPDARVHLIRALAATKIPSKGSVPKWLGAAADSEEAGMEDDLEAAGLNDEALDSDDTLEEDDQDAGDQYKKPLLKKLGKKVPAMAELAAKYPRLALLLPDAAAFWVAVGKWHLKEEDLVGVKEKVLLKQILFAHSWMRSANPSLAIWQALHETHAESQALTQLPSISPGLMVWLQESNLVTDDQVVPMVEDEDGERQFYEAQENSLSEDDKEELAALEELGGALASLDETGVIKDAGMGGEAPINAADYWTREGEVDGNSDGLRTASLAVRLYALGDKFTPEYARTIEKQPLYKTLFLSLLTHASPEAALAFLASPEASMRSLANKLAWEEEKKDKGTWSQTERLERRTKILKSLGSQDESAMNWAVWHQALHRLGDASRHSPERFAAIKSFARMMEVAEDWHKEFGSMQILSAAERAWPDFGRFPTPLIPGYEDGNYQFIYLGDSVQIAEEGAAMAHCVGTYRKQGMKGNSILYSVRQEGERIATAELNPNGRIQQLYGYKDALLSTEHEQVIRETLNQLVHDARRRRAVLVRSASKYGDKSSDTEGELDAWIESKVLSDMALAAIDRELVGRAGQGYQAARKRLAARAATVRHGTEDRAWLAKVRPGLLGYTRDIRQAVRAEILSVLAQQGLRQAREVVREKLPSEVTIFDAELVVKARERDPNDPGIAYLLEHRAELAALDETELQKRAGQFEQGPSSPVRELEAKSVTSIKQQKAAQGEAGRIR